MQAFMGYPFPFVIMRHPLERLPRTSGGLMGGKLDKYCTGAYVLGKWVDAEVLGEKATSSVEEVKTFG